MTDPSDPPAQSQALTVTEADDAPLPYDPAEYRWVPVRRVPRRDGWTEEKQRRFIETLADTGRVRLAAKEVGMTRESAYRLRRAPHAAGFARAWDDARRHAAGLIEDIAFDRAIEGVETDVFDQNGEVASTRIVYDNRLLRWLLAHLHPERYGAHASGAAVAAPPTTALIDSLRAMEPALPAPAEQLFSPADLADELQVADIADGALPQFHREQRPLRSDAKCAADEASARSARGADAFKRQDAGERLTEAEFADMCFHVDPSSNARRRKPSH